MRLLDGVPSAGVYLPRRGSSVSNRESPTAAEDTTLPSPSSSLRGRFVPHFALFPSVPPLFFRTCVRRPLTWHHSGSERAGPSRRRGEPKGEKTENSSVLADLFPIFPLFFLLFAPLNTERVSVYAAGWIAGFDTRLDICQPATIVRVLTWGEL